MKRPKKKISWLEGKKADKSLYEETEVGNKAHG